MKFELSPQEITQIGKAMAFEMMQSSHFQELIEAEVSKRVEGKKRLTQRQLAEVFQVKSRTITDWIKQGKITRYYPCGANLTLFDLDEVYEDIDRFHGTNNQIWYKAAG